MIKPTIVHNLKFKAILVVAYSLITVNYILSGIQIWNDIESAGFGSIARTIWSIMLSMTGLMWVILYTHRKENRQAKTAVV